MKYQFSKWFKKTLLDLAFYFQPKNKIFYKIATTKEEKERIYKLRYSIYVEELGRKLRCIDHASQMVKDELDELDCTEHFYHEENNQIVAALRATTFRPHQMTQDFKDKYYLNDYSWVDNYTWCEFTYAVVSKNLRSKLFYAKFLLSISREITKKVQFILASCKPYLIRRYLLLGCNLYSKHLISANDGIQIPIIWLVDSNVSQKISSPFRIITSKANDKIHKDHVNSITQVKTSVILEKKDILLDIESMKSKIPKLNFLKNFIFEYLIDHDCFIISVDQPMKIVHSDMNDKTIYLILEGEVNLHLNNYLIKLEPGSLIGEFSYFEHDSNSGKHEVDVECSQAKLLVIHKSALHELYKDHPKEYIYFLNLALKSSMDKTILIGNCNNLEKLVV